MPAETSCQSTRLQRRAPTSLQITAPARTWNVAIPLLSPIAASLVGHNRDMAKIASSGPEEEDEVMQKKRNIISRGYDEKKNDNKAEKFEQAKKTVLLKKWQHPKAPFHYEQRPPLEAPCLLPALIDNCP
uniref:Uncharacterized protein n=1 Tax=Kalanchoe fedtschenkoi TaxID=63787 RepID=A0A7N0V6Q4_KALFE